MTKNIQTIIVLFSHVSKVMLKILQARLQLYVKWELPYVQVGFRKGRGTRDQIANICWIIDKATEFQKNIFFCFIDYAKALCVSQQTGKFLKRWEYQTTLPASWETCMWVKKQQLELDMEQQDWFKIGKGVCQGCILSPCLFNLHGDASCKMQGWMNHKLESRLPGEITTPDMQMIPL